MPETLEDKLVIGISSRALFDLAEANEVFEQHGLSAFREYQREHEREILQPGTAYPLVKGLLGVNERAGEQLVDVIAQRFRVLGEPMRIRLLDRLRDGEATVQELQEATGASQQNVSKHLGVLLHAGIVRREKHGNYSRYAIADDSVFELCDQVCGGVRRQVDELDALLGGESR